MQKKNPKTHLKPKFLKALYRLENIRMKNSKKGGVVTDIQINTIIRGYIFKDRTKSSGVDLIGMRKK